MRATGNPGGPGQAWIKARYIDPAPPMVPFLDPATVDPLTGKGLWRVFIPSLLSDTPQLHDDPDARDRYIANLRASGPPWLVKAWLEGDWNASVEGGWVQPEWLAKRYSVEPEMAARGCSAIVLSVDTAAKDKASSCYSVCLAWGVADNHFYLLDVWRQKALFPELRRGVMGMRDKWKPIAVLIEDKSTGQALIPELRVDRQWGSTPIIPICPKPGDDKQTRFNRNLPFFESQLVILPMSSAWSLDYESEIKLFPLGANNDQVDATSQFLDWYTENQRYVAPRTGTFRQNYMAR
jgi:predicted phage terminase large subunit-like protein